MGFTVHTGQKPELLSKRLESVDEEEILARWFKIEKVPCVISSPFRDDKTPSFSVRYNKSGHIYGHDFATGEHFSVTDMVMKAENVDFKTAATMMLDGKYGEFVKDTTRPKARPATPTKIEVVVRPLESRDLAFWSSFGITAQWLEFGGIYPVSGIVFRSEDYIREMAAEEFAYAYITEWEGNIHTKIYQPFSKSRKWMNDGDGITQVWNLYGKLPDNGDNVIITSSLKDALCLWANTDIPSCCPQSESVMLDEKIVNDLKDRFNSVWVFFDNDFKNPNNPGQTNAKKVCDRYGLKNIVIDSWYGCKDPSDLYKRYGKSVLRKIVTKTITYEKKSEIG